MCCLSRMEIRRIQENARDELWIMCLIGVLRPCSGKFHSHDLFHDETGHCPGKTIENQHVAGMRIGS